MDATVVVDAVRTVGPRTVAIEFETPAEFGAQPGQFVKLAATVDGEEYARFYTLSSPDVEDTFEVTVEVDPEASGPFSEHLAALEPGDELDLSGPFGSNFYDGEARAVVLAGGPGVGPAVGIAERALGAGNDAAVVYLDDGHAHVERLESLAALGATVELDDADADLTSHARRALTDDPDEQVFVYGFASFVDRAREAIAAAGGDPDAAKVENFG